MKTIVVTFLLLKATLTLSIEDVYLDEANFLQSRITGGEIARPNDFPYQVGIYMALPTVGLDEPEKRMWCGGSLISNEYVLTAAHCLYGMSDVVIILGAHNIQGKEQGRIVIPVDAYNLIIHSEYDPDLSLNDIALLRLPGKVPLSEKINLIKLPKQSSENSIHEGQITISTGWGKMGDYIDMSNVLRFIKLEVINDHVCRLTFPYTYIASKMLCISGANKKSVCPGDSGGPLVVEDGTGSKTLVGLTSYGRNKCELGYPTVFTKVSAYLDWISQNTGLYV